MERKPQRGGLFPRVHVAMRTVIFGCQNWDWDLRDGTKDALKAPTIRHQVKQLVGRACSSVGRVLACQA